MAQTKTPISFSSTIADPQGNINTQLAHKTLQQKILSHKSEYGVKTVAQHQTADSSSAARRTSQLPAAGSKTT